MNGWSIFVRQTTVLCLLLAVSLAVVLLALKHQVQQLSDQLGSLNREIVAEQESMQVLKAEFAYLTQPDRLRRLASQHLGLAPVEPRQLATFATLDNVLALSAAPAPSSAKGSKQTAGAQSAVHLAARARGTQR